MDIFIYLPFKHLPGQLSVAVSFWALLQTFIKKKKNYFFDWSDSKQNYMFIFIFIYAFAGLCPSIIDYYVPSLKRVSFEMDIQRHNSQMTGTHYQHEIKPKIIR